jgi:hypothetical protein
MSTDKYGLCSASAIEHLQTYEELAILIPENDRWLKILVYMMIDSISTIPNFMMLLKGSTTM